MGTIYRNGVPFVGSGGAGGVEMTQAEYDLLPTSEKMNGAIYFITDGDVSYPSASQMRYDNTESQIPATTVQGAIDENRIEINDLKNGLSSLPKIQSGLTNATCPASAQLTMQITFTTPFTTTPTVVANIYGSFTPYSELTGPSVMDVNRYGFKARVKSTYSSDLQFGLSWIAIGS